MHSNKITIQGRIGREKTGVSEAAAITEITYLAICEEFLVCHRIFKMQIQPCGICELHGSGCEW